MFLNLLSKDEEKAEKKPNQTRRGRSPLKKEKKEALLVDWAWENVQGQSESRARDRRSRSRSRDRNPNTSVGEIIQVYYTGNNKSCIKQNFLGGEN